jgi:TPR repeat protein
LHCKLCDRWRENLARKSDAWERDHSNESELWSEEPPDNRALIDQAYALYSTDPAASFRLYLEAAEAGSAWAMEEAARLYERGAAGAADLEKAELYFRRAISAGSSMATIGYARFLAGQDRHEECLRVLEQGVEAGFVPACYWLARFRYDRSPSRGLCREIRPLIERAASAGHPLAEVFLARLKTLGKFGLREIPAGLAAAARMALREARSEDGEAADIRRSEGEEDGRRRIGPPTP